MDAVQHDLEQPGVPADTESVNTIRLQANGSATYMRLWRKVSQAKGSHDTLQEDVVDPAVRLPASAQIAPITHANVDADDIFRQYNIEYGRAHEWTGRLEASHVPEGRRARPSNDACSGPLQHHVGRPNVEHGQLTNVDGDQVCAHVGLHHVTQFGGILELLCIDRDTSASPMPPILNGTQHFRTGACQHSQVVEGEVKPWQIKQQFIQKASSFVV